MADADSGDDGTVSYQFKIERDTWRDWTETVPRRTALHTRLRTLIDQDLRAARRDEDRGEDATVDLLASRVRIRAMHVREAIEGESVDAETATDHLDELLDIADALET
jgi:hypothetical protein